MQNYRYNLLDCMEAYVEGRLQIRTDKEQVRKIASKVKSIASNFSMDMETIAASYVSALHMLVQDTEVKHLKRIVGGAFVSNLVRVYTTEELQNDVLPSMTDKKLKILLIVMYSLLEYINGVVKKTGELSHTNEQFIVYAKKVLDIIDRRCYTKGRCKKLFKLYQNLCNELILEHGIIVVRADGNE